jgi:protein-tyrosine phosphatase
MSFIDVHSHLLPGIDDGAPDVAVSVAMAKIAVEQGVTHCVCTPHIQPGQFDNTLESIAAAFAIFKKALEDNEIDLRVATAAECHFGLEVISGVENGTLPFLGDWGGKKVILLEFPHGMVPFGAEQLTKWLLEHGVIPMIAHPERNRGFVASPSLIKPFLRQGCLLQVTASSFTGRFGRSAQKLAENLAREAVITVVASDAHNLESRPPLFVDAAHRLEKLAGADKARAWLSDNPGVLTERLFSEL